MPLPVSPPESHCTTSRLWKPCTFPGCTMITVAIMVRNGTSGMAVGVGPVVVAVGVAVGVLVAVLVAVGVAVGVLVAGGVAVGVGVLVVGGVAVGVGVLVAVGVAVGVLVAVGVAVGVVVAVLVAVGVAVGVVVACPSSPGSSGGFDTAGRLVNAMTLSPTLMPAIPASDSGRSLMTVSLVTSATTVPWRVLMVIDELPTSSTVPEMVLRVSCPEGTCCDGAASVTPVCATSWTSGPPTTERTSKPATSGLTPSEIAACNHSLMAIPSRALLRLEGHD